MDVGLSIVVDFGDSTGFGLSTFLGLGLLGATVGVAFAFAEFCGDFICSACFKFSAALFGLDLLVEIVIDDLSSSERTKENNNFIKFTFFLGSSNLFAECQFTLFIDRNE